MNARDRIHAMLPICDSPAEAEARAQELDKRLDAVVAAALHAAADEIDRAQNRLVVKKTVVNILRRRANRAGEGR